MKKIIILFLSWFIVSCGSKVAFVKYGPVTLQKSPEVLSVKSSPDSVPAEYIFHNNTTNKIVFFSREAYFASSDGIWTSGIIGPFDTPAVVNPGDKWIFNDEIFVPSDVIDSIIDEGKMDGEKFAFVQIFHYTNHHIHCEIVVRWTVKLDYSQWHQDIVKKETPYYKVQINPAYFSNSAASERLDSFLGYFYKVYSGLEKTLGYLPIGGGKIKLKLTEWGGFPYFAPAASGPFVSIPASLIVNNDDWLYVVFPHELTHYFLLTEFPNPPRWMMEGPASYFAGKVCAALGYQKIAVDDGVKISKWGAEYAAEGKDYLFTDDWPQDNTGDHPLGFGRAFQLMGDIEKLCGSDIFSRMFAQWKQDGFRFPAGKSSMEKTALVIDSLVKLSGKDVMKLFREYGYTGK